MKQASSSSIVRPTVFDAKEEPEQTGREVEGYPDKVVL